MKLRHYLAVALSTIILYGVTWPGCAVPRRCNPRIVSTCEPE